MNIDGKNPYTMKINFDNIETAQNFKYFGESLTPNINETVPIEEVVTPTMEISFRV